MSRKNEDLLAFFIKTIYYFLCFERFFIKIKTEVLFWGSLPFLDVRIIIPFYPNFALRKSLMMSWIC